MASSVSGQDVANFVFWLATWVSKMEQYYMLGIANFVPAITFPQSPSKCRRVFYCKIFSVTLKRLSVISLSGWNQKTSKPKRAITFACNWIPFQCSKRNKYEDDFFSVFYAKSFISVHKNTKRELGRCNQPSWPHAWSMIDTHKN